MFDIEGICGLECSEVDDLESAAHNKAMGDDDDGDNLLNGGDDFDITEEDIAKYILSANDDEGDNGDIELTDEDIAELTAEIAAETEDDEPDYALIAELKSLLGI